jgi:predicted nucleotide-binding protein (sugar kinase/HSP70/actin superfamily)
VKSRIGIPRCLLYYPFFSFWERFFRELNLEVVVSKPMTAACFDRMERPFTGDICLPIESTFYHVQALRNEADWIFLPRMNSPHKDVYVCPACAGLPDIVQHVLPDLPPLLTVPLTPFRQLCRDDLAAFKALGCSGALAKRAFAAAHDHYGKFVESARTHPLLEEALGGGAFSPDKDDDGVHSRILLLGMPYVLNDPFVNQGIPQMLRMRGCRVTTPFMVAPELVHREVSIGEYLIYWTFAAMSVGSLVRVLSGGAVDGVIYCSSFACGVDSLIVPIVQSACRRCHNLPMSTLVLDEHSEPAYLELRLEAFLDCLEPQLPGKVSS